MHSKLVRLLQIHVPGVGAGDAYYQAISDYVDTDDVVTATTSNTRDQKRAQLLNHYLIQYTRFVPPLESERYDR